MTTKNLHENYDPQIEDQDEMKFQMMNDMAPLPGRHIVDEWSRQAMDNIKNEQDFDQWVFGMIKLSRARWGRE